MHHRKVISGGISGLIPTFPQSTNLVPPCATSGSLVPPFLNPNNCLPAVQEYPAGIYLNYYGAIGINSRLQDVRKT